MSIYSITDFPKNYNRYFSLSHRKVKKAAAGRTGNGITLHQSSSITLAIKVPFFRLRPAAPLFFCQFYNDPGTIAMEPIGEFCGVLGIVSSVRTLTVRGTTADDIQVAAIDLNGKTDRHILPPDSRRLIHASENTDTATKVMQAIMEHQRTATLFPYQTVA